MTRKRSNKAQPAAVKKPVQASISLPTTVSAIRNDPNLGYKLRALIYDLLNISRDPCSERRLNTTTDEHYLSLPYFSSEESQVIKNAVIDVEPALYNVPGDFGEDDARLISRSVADALELVLSGFFDKRRASGDSRPCGPHHLAPLYAALYGINLAELQDAKFLARLRRNGI
ncbi:hypothetical protein CCM_08693 [Cordyceps militaris CM01]|uniref:Uncharacterized protein n=1 Tax=Cordyceps militaris (strain CM01) TaxID=983644 RepID=G3JS02_CORMM|nr:uncharacterized protein CCM_08693 [Cordyceps militaris CM01]EGX88648.1 hypothetical protein CCM_08693 [Cordyceps militaris CM01]